MSSYIIGIGAGVLLFNVVYINMLCGRGGKYEKGCRCKNDNCRSNNDCFYHKISYSAQGAGEAEECIVLYRMKKN